MVRDLGFQVEGSAVESGAFDLAINCKYLAALVCKYVVLHGTKKAPGRGLQTLWEPAYAVRNVVVRPWSGRLTPLTACVIAPSTIRTR